MSSKGHVGIFVGLDQLGKTPLIQLCADIDPRVRKVQLLKDPRTVGPEVPIQMAESEVSKWETLHGTPLTQDLFLLYDRFPYPDDYVYQEFTQQPRKKSLFEKRLQILEKRMTLVDVGIVYIEPREWGTFAAHIRKNPDSMIPNASWFYLAQRRYEEFLRSTSIPVKRVKHKFFNENDAIEILEWIATL